MTQSMTGFAAGSFAIDGVTFTVEIKSYNHRFLDITVKLPRQFGAAETHLKKQISGAVSRGKVDVFVSVADYPVSQLIEREKIAEVHRFLKKVKSELGMGKEVSFAEVFMLRDFFMSGSDRTAPGDDVIGKFLKKTASIVRDFVKTRNTEGRELGRDIAVRLRKIQNSMDRVEKLSVGIKRHHKERLQSRLDQVLDRNLSRDRLEQEVTLMLDRLDISEEITRMRAHMANFAKIMAGSEPAGKKLDFYAQEMLREVNTLSVKSQDACMTEQAIEMKNEIEKIREQVQNVE